MWLCGFVAKHHTALIVTWNTDMLLVAHPTRV